MKSKINIKELFYNYYFEALSTSNVLMGKIDMGETRS